MSHRRPLALSIFVRTALVALACLALQACSTVRLAYEQFPALAQWRLNSYLDLSDAQTSRVRNDLEELHRWHQSEVLPQQVEMLRAVRLQLAGDLSVSQACATYEMARTQMFSLVERAEPSMIWLAMSLSDKQIAQIEERLAKDNAKWREEWLDIPPQERIEARYEQWLSRSENIYGRLELPQKATVRRAVDSSSFESQQAWERRVSTQRDLLKTLRAIQREKPSSELAKTMVRGWLERTLWPKDPEQQSQAQRLREDGCRTFALIHNSTTRSQRESAMRTLKGYEEDFKAKIASERQGG